MDLIKHLAGGTSILMKKIKELGFLRNKDEHYVYVRSSGRVVVFHVMYVNGILLKGNNIPKLNSVKAWLGKKILYEVLGIIYLHTWYQNL